MLIATVSEWVDLTSYITKYLFAQETAAAIYFYVKVLIIPTSLGVMIGWSLNSGWKNAFLRRLYLPATHPVETGHDFAFGNYRESCFVLATYQDSTLIGGYFGENSLAASNSEKSDLYLERVYAIDRNGKWTEPMPARSGLISLSNVRSIEFLDAEETKI